MTARGRTIQPFRHIRGYDDWGPFVAIRSGEQLERGEGGADQSLAFVSASRTSVMRAPERMLARP